MEGAGTEEGRSVKGALVVFGSLLSDEESGPTDVSSPSYVMEACKSVAGKALTNRHSALKSRGITLPTEVPIVKAVVFPTVMYRCESWTVKKAEHRGMDAFKLCCWGRLLRVPWAARRLNQSIPKEISSNIQRKA